MHEWEWWKNWLLMHCSGDYYVIKAALQNSERPHKQKTPLLIVKAEKTVHIQIMREMWFQLLPIPLWHLVFELVEAYSFWNGWFESFETV